MKVPYTIELETGCWKWNGGTRNGGYGNPTYAMQKAGFSAAHRWYYAQRHGECPSTLDHLCRNRACVNPDHLEPCSRGENVRRGDVAILDWEKVTEIRELAEQTEGSMRAKARELAPLYGVSHHAVKNILLNQRWREEDRPK